MKKIMIPFLASAALLTGCASQMSAYMPPPPPSGDPATMQLAQAATAVTHSLSTLEGIRKAENPQFQKKLPNPQTFNMNQLASVDWTGPIQPLVQKLAIASGYHLRVLGTKPAIPIIISIHAENLPLAIILRNADYQAGKNAYIKVYAKRKVIELRYSRV